MAIEDAERDNNYVTTLLAVDMTTGNIPTKLYADETTHRLLVNAVISSESAPSTLVSFITTVTTAGTRVQLASNATVGIILEAPSTNTGLIYVGGSSVSSSDFGAELQAGQSVGLAISNTNKVYVDSSVNGEKVAVLGS